MECPACRENIPPENVGTNLLEGEDEVVCHLCGAHLVVTLEIMSR